MEIQNLSTERRNDIEQYLSNSEEQIIRNMLRTHSEKADVLCLVDFRKNTKEVLMSVFKYGVLVGTNIGIQEILSIQQTNNKNN